MFLSAGFVNLPGGSEWIIIFLVILIIFGPKSLPKIGNAIGRGIREFKDASDGITKAIEEESASEPDYGYDESATSGYEETEEAAVTAEPPESESGDALESEPGDSPDSDKSEEYRD